MIPEWIIGIAGVAVWLWAIDYNMRDNPENEGRGLPEKIKDWLEELD